MAPYLGLCCHQFKEALASLKKDALLNLRRPTIVLILSYLIATDVFVLFGAGDLQI